jgi:histidine phosphotransferase ChpT
MTQPQTSADWSPSSAEETPEASAPKANPAQRLSGVELAGALSARLCHDFISPASAIASGLDLLEDPTAQDMREDALNLISTSARKLVALLAFSRVAFGSSAGAESFDARDLETLAQGIFAHVRPELAWEVEPSSLPKPAARVALNLAQIGAGALPTGGRARLFARPEGDGLVVGLEAIGARARLKPEVEAGLRGQPLPEGSLAGHWIQAYLLHDLIAAAGGALNVETEPEKVALTATLSI